MLVDVRLHDATEGQEPVLLIDQFLFMLPMRPFCVAVSARFICHTGLRFALQQQDVEKIEWKPLMARRFLFSP